MPKRARPALELVLQDICKKNAGFSFCLPRLMLGSHRIPRAEELIQVALRVAIGLIAARKAHVVFTQIFLDRIIVLDRWQAPHTALIY